MKICTIGTGYVGLVTGALFADRGNDVICVDNNPSIVEKLNAGKIHIFEPGLEDIVSKSVKRGNLSFTMDTASAVSASDIVILAVGTPSNKNGSFNLKYLKNAAKDAGKALASSEGFKVVVGKSTVPQGTNEVVSDIIDSYVSSDRWAYVSNPETLAEGTAVRDFSKPDRVMIGTDSDEAFEVMRSLYHPFIGRDSQIVRGTPADAELSKLFANTSLAARVAMVNEFARIADITPGADMDIIRQMVCEDARIGYSFMFPGPGYGGSCFPKDVQGLVCQSRKDGYNPSLLSKIHCSNEEHKNYIGEKISGLLDSGARVAVWGLTFKPNTDDMRDSASVPIITGLLNRGASVSAYDPQDVKAREIFGDSVDFFDDKYETLKSADALVLLTEWDEFGSPDYGRLHKLMKGNALFDMRNKWVPQDANKNGFNYYGVGRNYPLKKKNG